MDTILNETVKGIFPALADLDNDGDVDMIVGDNNGKLHYFKNNADIGQDAVFELENVNFFNIDIGQHSAPFLYDMNNDNLFDLIIGQVDGTITYAENTGRLIIRFSIRLLKILEVCQSIMMKVYMDLALLLSLNKTMK